MYFTIVCRVFVINQTQRLSNSQRKAASDKISNLSVSYGPTQILFMYDICTIKVNLWLNLANSGWNLYTNDFIGD